MSARLSLEISGRWPLVRNPSRSSLNDAEAASVFLSDPDTGPGSVVYLESTEEPIVIAGNTPMGSPEKPVILVVDTKNSGHAIDWRGTSQFYGVVIVVGDAVLRGTNDICGCVLSDGVRGEQRRSRSQV